MNLALFGDPYYVKMVLKNANYVYKDCNKIYVPDFMVTDSENSISFNVSVDCNSAFSSGVIDEVLTFYRDNLIPDGIKRLLNEPPKTICVKNINTTNIVNSFKTKEFNKAILKTKPSILSLSLGRVSQQYHVELIINKYLSKMNLNFYQCFSPESRYILKAQNFNNSCFDIYKNCRHNYDLFVGGLTASGINELHNNHSTVCSLIDKMFPDSVVISCNSTPSFIYNDLCPTINLFKYRYSVKNIIVVLSEYYFNEALNVSIKIPPQNININEKCFFISKFNKLTEAEFINHLLSPVYLPDGIVLV